MTKKQTIKEDFDQPEKKRSKFNVSKNKDNRIYDGIVFDSAVEMKYYRDVILLGVENGEIIHFERQKKYILQPGFVHDGKRILPIEYKADFYVEYSDGTNKVIDIKGCPDAGALMKRKMFWYVYPELNYVWLAFSRIDGGWCTYEEVKEGRKQRKKAKANKVIQGE